MSRHRITATKGPLRTAVATRVVVLRVLGAAALFAALSVPAFAVPCALGVGQAVSLKSTDLDPDVFVWDSKQRAVEYAAGYWKDTRDVLAHSLLAKPGTRAMVVQCAPGAIHSKYASDLEDAIGVRIQNGPNKGRYGWVTSEDVHELLVRDTTARR